MAETSVSPRNKSVKFRGSPTAERPRGTNPKPKFGGKADKLAAMAPTFPKPKRMGAKMRRAVKPARARGMVSEAAMKKHLGEY